MQRRSIKINDLINYLDLNFDLNDYEHNYIIGLSDEYWKKLIHDFIKNNN
jgi:hypothetical protein